MNLLRTRERMARLPRERMPRLTRLRSRLLRKKPQRRLERKWRSPSGTNKMLFFFCTKCKQFVSFVHSRMGRFCIERSILGAPLRTLHAMLNYTVAQNILV